MKPRNIIILTPLVCSLVSLLFLICYYGPNYQTQEAKEFLFENPTAKITQPFRGSFGTINEITYDKYSSTNTFSSFNENDIIIFEIDGQRHEVLLSNKPKQIGDTKYKVLLEERRWRYCLVIQKPKNKTTNKSEKEESMIAGLSLGTWAAIIVVCFIVIAISKHTSLKTIFRPTKKAAKHVKKEWEES